MADSSSSSLSFFGRLFRQKPQASCSTHATEPIVHFCRNQIVKDSTILCALFATASGISLYFSILVSLVLILLVSNLYICVLWYRFSAEQQQLTNGTFAQHQQPVEAKGTNGRSLSSIGSLVQRSAKQYGPHRLHDTNFDVVCKDAIQWLTEQENFDGTSFVTSLPDFSEINMPVEQWREWFIHGCELILSKLQGSQVAIFYQTDVKVLREKSDLCMQWVDKSDLCHRAAARQHCVLQWRKILLLNQVGSIKHGRPCYSHMLCFAKQPIFNVTKHSMPDVHHRGDMLYSKGMGLDACMMAVGFCKAIGATRIVDPFCGKGSVLVAANYMGLDALGVDISATRVRNAKSMREHQMDNFHKIAQQIYF